LAHLGKVRVQFSGFLPKHWLVQNQLLK
jgi:hypothetical protein